MSPEQRERLDLLHAACVGLHPVEIAYVRQDGEASRRTVRPLGLYFWSGVWTLVTWCELREGFRTFRLDRIRESSVLEAKFQQGRGQTLRDYLRSVGAPDGNADWRPPRNH
jgi:predicted DNA-binding transcriptional regulator YafY